MRRSVYRVDELLRLRQNSAWLAFRNISTRKLDAITRPVPHTKWPVAEVLKISPATRAAMEKLRSHRDPRTSSDDSRDVVVTLPDATEWQYRGRAGDEIGTPQPLSAPSGLATQRDEGFQRFYKAVVSPTHVRVTAGGRIVPNTRGSQSPNVRKETPSEPAQAQPQQSTQAKASTLQEPAHTATPVSLPLGYHAAFPGYPPGVFAPAQFPFPHIPLGFNVGGGLSLPHFAMNRHVSNQSEPLASQPVSHAQGLDGAGGVRISPPGQFDPTRPYFVNGQWMVPLGAQTYPYGLQPLVPHPGLTNHYGGGAAMPQGPVPAQTNAYPNQEAQSTQTNRTQPPTPINAPVHPPISSIRPSQITKSHIESLKNNLKRVEDQLQYNIHQIDVKHMEGLAKEIRASIKALQEALPKQLEFEDLHYPKAEKQESKPNGELFNPPVSHDTSRKEHVSQGRKNEAAARVPTNAAKGPRSVFSTGSGVPRSGSTDSEPLRRCSGLPRTAATAPPFQPYNNHATSKHTASSGDDSAASREVARNRFQRLETKGFEAISMDQSGEARQDSTPVQPKPLVNGFAHSPAPAAKKGMDAATLPKSVPCSVTTPLAGVGQKDMDNVRRPSCSYEGCLWHANPYSRSLRVRRLLGSDDRRTGAGKSPYSEENRSAMGVRLG